MRDRGSGRVADNDRPSVERADDVCVVRDDAIARDPVRLLPGFCDRARLARPARRHRVVPAARNLSTRPPQDVACKNMLWTNTTGAPVTAIAFPLTIGSGVCRRLGNTAK